MRSGINHFVFVCDYNAQQRLQSVRHKLWEGLSQGTKDKLFFWEGSLEEMPREGISEFDLTLLDSIQSLLYAEERIDLLQEWITILTQRSE